MQLLFCCYLSSENRYHDGINESESNPFQKIMLAVTQFLQISF
jgi:hypothetical protein